MKKAVLFFTIILLVSFGGNNIKAQEIKADSMPSVKIGTQIWTSKNLNVTTFRNGDAIPEAKTAREWKVAGNMETPAWCYYNFDSINGKKYGKLYNWYAVNDKRGLAPAGWHIPTDKEWATLKKYLGANGGKKLKSATGWQWDSVENRDGNGDNSTGFSALPVTGCDDMGLFLSPVGYYAYFWSKKSSGDIRPRAISCSLSNCDAVIYIFPTYWKNGGNSCRCIKDLKNLVQLSK
jgi:uncharacterized protein (TIGR02145 family)